MQGKDASLAALCPSEEVLAAWLGGGLAHHEVRALQVHLDHCDLCRQLVALVAAPASDTVSGGPLGPSDAAPISRTVGERGRYVVIEEVGRGAMGRVLRAYDTTLQREVAIKEVLAAQPGAQAEQRLAAEARAMARLTHRNVVRVYGVEESGAGHVLVVMEYVPGETLEQWLQSERGRPSSSAIVQRFVEAGRGLAAAHAAGLLHRDFKAANVLVAQRRDERGRPRIKVTDFGLAKAVRASEASLRLGSGEGLSDSCTRRGTVVGTPLYMAPEQHVGGPLTPAADQYAFCVALWKALCGRWPFPGPDLAQQKMNGSPPWPDHSVPRRVAQAVRRGLAPRPADRFASMGALLDALQPRAAARRRWLVLGASVAVASAVAWTVDRGHPCEAAEQALDPSWNDALRGRVEQAMLGVDRPFAHRAWERAAEGLDAYASEWTRIHTQACEATLVRHERPEPVLDLQMACLRRAATDLGAAVEQLSSADEEVVLNAHRVVDGLYPLATCEDLEALPEAVDAPAPREQAVVAGIRELLAQARAQQDAGKYDDALAVVHEADTAAHGLDYEPIRTDIALRRGAVLRAMSRFDESAQAHREALALALRSRQSTQAGKAARGMAYIVGYRDRRLGEGHRYLAVARGLVGDAPEGRRSVESTLASLWMAEGHYDRALEKYRAVLADREAAPSPDNLALALAQSNLAVAYDQTGRYEDSEVEYRAALKSWTAALGAHHPEVLRARRNVAGALARMGRYAEAESEHRAVLGSRVAVLGEEHPDVTDSHADVGLALLGQGRYDEAVEEFRVVLARSIAENGPDHVRVAATRSDLGSALNRAGDYAGAAEEARRALEIFENAFDIDHPYVATSRSILATALKRQGRTEAALIEYRRVLDSRVRSLGPAHPHTALARGNLALVLRTTGQLGEAERQARASLIRLETSEGKDHIHVGMGRLNLGMILESADRPEDARVEMETAQKVFEAALGAAHPYTARCQVRLALLALRQGNARDALPLAEQAWTHLDDEGVAADDAAEAAFVLAQALQGSAQGRAARARSTQLAQRATELARESGNEDQIDEIETWRERSGV